MTCLDSMTFGEVKALAASLSTLVGSSPSTSIFNRFVGQFCIIRASGAGVHAGVIASVSTSPDGLMQVVAKDVRRLWSWTVKDKKGVSLSGVATFGLQRDACKIETAIREQAIAGVCELIPCTDEARESINGK